MRRPTTPGHMVIHQHGAGGGGDAFLNHLTFEDHPRRGAQRGLVNFAGDNGGFDTFGNPTGDSATTDIDTWAQANLNVDPPYVLVGGSMGALTSCNWAKRNPTLVAGIVLLIPALDLEDFHDNNRGGYAATIEAAYGGLAGYQAAVPDRSPILWPEDLDGIPIRIYSANNDPYCLPAITAAFVAATGAEHVDLGAVGHTTIGLIDPDDVADFAWECLEAA